VFEVLHTAHFEANVHGVRYADVDSLHPSIFDEDLFGEHCDLLPVSIVFGFEPHSGDLAIHGPAAGVSQGELSQRNNVKYGRPRVLEPANGKRDSGAISMFRHTASFELRKQHNSFGGKVLCATSRSAGIAGPTHQ
jgi:hypothetical protein